MSISSMRRRELVTLDSTNVTRYHRTVIKSFRGRETETVWRREYSKRIPREIQERALMKLQQLNAAGDLRDLSIPSSNKLETLKGDRKGEYSIRINKQWRVCFRWRDGHAFDVEIVDYH